MNQSKILVIDFGAQYAQLIARRVREASVYSEIVPNSTTVDEIKAHAPVALILTGGPSSVYEENAPRLDPEIFKLGIPILGICYGFQLMADELGGVVDKSANGEYGNTTVDIKTAGTLLKDSPSVQSVWMSHSVAVKTLPKGFTLLAESKDAPVAAMENKELGFYGVQWHPEVNHTKLGQKVFENFLYDAVGVTPDWNAQNIINAEVESIRKVVGSGKVICGLSGGVDSAVAAALVHKAIGDQLTCVFVDNGLLRKGEREQVERDFAKAFNVKLVVQDATEEFLTSLKGVEEPEQKRKIVGREFIRAFEKAVESALGGGAPVAAGAVGGARRGAGASPIDLPASEGVAGAGVAAGAGGARLAPASAGAAEFLVQGTLYPDIVESGGGTGTSNIKSHHNVGGLPKDLKFKLIEPLRSLFKDEVRRIGRELGVSEEIVSRQPFPGPSLSIRIIGEVNEVNLEILRNADAIVREELTTAGLDTEIWQCPVVLLANVRSVGVQGDARTYGHPIVLRPVSSQDAMTADFSRIPYDTLATISNRITNEVKEINRVTLDITSKPPATIEWE